jgi:hypothetical protein
MRVKLIIIVYKEMGLRHGKLSELIWYGFTAGIVYIGISAYKPRYFYTFANVQRI